MGTFPSEYDYVVVGAGPCGLAFAQCAQSVGKRVVVVDAEDTIGGCHRVRRVTVDGKRLFTEHGPRVYSDTYATFQQLLTHMGVSFHEIFAPYDFSIATIGSSTVFQSLTYTELVKLVIAFLKLTFDSSYGTQQTVAAFGVAHGFSNRAMDMIDRVCRLTDGAGADRYTLNQFLQLANQQYMYTLYQPRAANDKLLFKVWGEYLSQNTCGKPRVDFVMRRTVNAVVTDKHGVVRGVDTALGMVAGKNVVLAVPPIAAARILGASASSTVRNAFMADDAVSAFARTTDYELYIPITYHYFTEQRLPRVHGFPRSDWGVAFVVMSDYFAKETEDSATVISIGVTMPERIARRIGKTVHQCSKGEMLQEVFEQMREAFPKLERPDVVLLSPGVTFDGKKWVSKDTAFIQTSAQPFPQVSTIPCLFAIGTHNLKSMYAFTSLESAVSNAVSLSHTLFPKTKQKFPIRSRVTVKNVLARLVVIIAITLSVLVRRKYFSG